MMRIAIFASHGGSLLQAIIDACENNTKGIGWLPTYPTAAENEYFAEALRKAGWEG